MNNNAINISQDREIKILTFSIHLYRKKFIIRNVFHGSHKNVTAYRCLRQQLCATWG